MVSPRTRADIWQDLLDANRLVRYYEALTNRYQLWQQAIRLLLLAIIVSNLGGVRRSSSEVSPDQCRFSSRFVDSLGLGD